MPQGLISAMNPTTWLYPEPGQPTGTVLRVHHRRVKGDGRLAETVRIQTVAMQSTGVYWVAVYDILEQVGLEVYLVNARDTKNLPGEKATYRRVSG